MAQKPLNQSQLGTIDADSVNGATVGSGAGQIPILDGSSQLPASVVPSGGVSASADTLTTPRQISLSGNASGSVNFDGSANVTINTTVSQAANATNATNATTAANSLLLGNQNLAHVLNRANHTGTDTNPSPSINSSGIYVGTTTGGGIGWASQVISIAFGSNFGWRITHNLGHTNYIVVCNVAPPMAANFNGNSTAGVFAITANSFDIESRVSTDDGNNTGTARNNASYILIEF